MLDKKEKRIVTGKSYRSTHLRLIKVCNILLWFCLVCFCVSCNNNKQPANTAKYEKAKWVIKEDKDYPYREDMLKDLMDHHDLHKAKSAAIFQLLGEPDRIDNNHLFYRVSQKRFGFLPLHTRTLVIKLRTDSTVEWVKIHQ